MRRNPSSSKLTALVILPFGLFLTTTLFHLSPSRGVSNTTIDSVVISAPIQTLMYAGDRYLAANLETIRVAAIGPTEEEALVSYRIRAHTLISELNPCNQDNYFLANAMLTWGGSVEEGNNILKNATECRFWDEIPPFFLGFNLYYFNRDIDRARHYIDLAASRSSSDNRASLQKISITMAANKLNDDRMAVLYLQQQRDETNDQKLKEMLDRRLARLNGLIILRDAQEKYEKEFNSPLKSPEQLIQSGIIMEFPVDPMRVGYEFHNGHFRLKAANIGGIEIR